MWKSVAGFFVSQLLFRCIWKYYESLLGLRVQNNVVWLKFWLTNAKIWLNNSKLRLPDRGFDMGQLFAVKIHI